MLKFFQFFALSLGTVIVLTGCSISAPLARVAITQPENASGYQSKPGWVHSHFSIAAANPLATAAGSQILNKGGSAIDAAIAVQMVLTLVEPQSSGIGGGAFLMHFDGTHVEAFDGRETAPVAATEDLFLNTSGTTPSFYDAAIGGRSVGVPGTVRMLEMVHKQHGKLPWNTLFEPAITLAKNGFMVSARLYELLRTDQHLKKDPVALGYFYTPNGIPHDVGHVLKNPALAEVLEKIATLGSLALLEGEIAQAIVAKVQGHAMNPGTLSLSDLAAYKPEKRDPFCHDYRGSHKDFQLCGFPPPSSGAIAIAQILGILNTTSAASLPLENQLPSAQWLHLYTEASRLAFADRALYVGDPDYVRAPAENWKSLIAPAYLAQRAQLIDQSPNGFSIKMATPGTPIGVQTSYAPMPEQVEYGTSHMSIVDAKGNAIAMTTTIEDAFGSRQMVNVNPELKGGFLLNNELTDFSFSPTDAAGIPVANRVQPGKRPRSSMSPTLIFDKSTGALVMTGGSPGGAMIIHYTAKSIYGMLNWGLTPQEAINLPNFGSLNGPTVLEENRFPESTLNALRMKGHDLREAPLTSGLQAIARGQAQGKAVWTGGADPRREGVVMGE